MFETEERPWGKFEVLLDSDACKVKRITVNPGQRLSYQKHKHRQEAWVVIKGTATVVLDGTDHVVPSGKSIEIPLGAAHRLANPTSEPVVIIETQTGTYFGEDDIIRLEDDYQRC